MKYEVKTNQASKYANTKPLSKDHAIKKVRGTFCTITYRKKDGTVITLNGRTGVHKGVKGTRNYTLPKGRFTFWSVSKDHKGYRTLITDNIISIRANGLEVNYG